MLPSLGTVISSMRVLLPPLEGKFEKKTYFVGYRFVCFLGHWITKSGWFFNRTPLSSQPGLVLIWNLEKSWKKNLIKIVIYLPGRRLRTTSWVIALPPVIRRSTATPTRGKKFAKSTRTACVALWTELYHETAYSRVLRNTRKSWNLYGRWRGFVTHNYLISIFSFELIIFHASIFRQFTRNPEKPIEKWNKTTETLIGFVLVTITMPV